MKAGFILSIVLAVGLQAPCQAQELRKISTAALKRIVQKEDAVYVINFWATWCEPCREELPSLLKIAKKFAADDVKVILVSLDYPGAYPGRLKAFIKKHHIGVPVLWLDVTNPRTLADAVYPAWKGLIPFTIFLNRKKGYQHIIGQEIPAGEWDAEIKKAL